MAADITEQSRKHTWVDVDLVMVPKVASKVNVHNSGSTSEGIDKVVLRELTSPNDATDAADGPLVLVALVVVALVGQSRDHVAPMSAASLFEVPSRTVLEPAKTK